MRQRQRQRHRFGPQTLTHQIFDITQVGIQHPRATASRIRSIAGRTAWATLGGRALTLNGHSVPSSDKHFSFRPSWPKWPRIANFRRDLTFSIAVVTAASVPEP